MELLEHPSARSASQPFRPKKAQDWDRYKDVVADLYAKNELDTAIEIMLKTYNFSATYAITVLPALRTHC
jgi:hypothetical protein